MDRFKPRDNLPKGDSKTVFDVNEDEWDDLNDRYFR